MVYRKDDSAVRDAQDGLEDLTFQKQIDDIDKSIDALNQQMENATKQIDIQIEAINAYMNKWSEISSLYEKTMNQTIATSMLGNDWQTQVLNGNTALLENFTQTYLETQQRLNDFNTSLADANVISAAESVKEIGGDLSSINYLWADMSEDINAKLVELNENQLPILIGDEDGTTGIYGAVNVTDGLRTTWDNVCTSINNAIAALDVYNSKAAASAGGVFTRFTFNANGTVGNAFANGTNYGALSHAENALTSEYGQPELIVYPDGKYELTTEPTLQKLPKNTEIFNEEQTRRILKNGGIKGDAFANGTNAKFTPLSSEESAKIDKLSRLLTSADNIGMYTNEINKKLAQINVEMNASVTPQNASPTYTFNGGINVTCPGVTSEEVARNLPSALESAFNGLSLNAYQFSMKR